VNVAVNGVTTINGLLLTVRVIGIVIEGLVVEDDVIVIDPLHVVDWVNADNPVTKTWIVAGVVSIPCWLIPRNPGQVDVAVVTLIGTDELLPAEIVRKVEESNV
jgi:hypothetical protein